MKGGGGMNIPHYVSDLIENLNIGIFFLDKNLEIFYANHAFLNMIELDRGELERVRPHILDIFPEIDEGVLDEKKELLTDRGILKLITGYEDLSFYGIGILNPHGLLGIIKSGLSMVRRGITEMAVVLIAIEIKDKECKEEKYRYLQFVKENLQSILRETDIIDETSFIKYGEGEILILLFMKERTYEGLRAVIDRIRGVADKSEGCIKGISIAGTFATENDTFSTLMERISRLLKDARPQGSLIDVEEK